jgi:hypothetical protein
MFKVFNRSRPPRYPTIREALVHSGLSTAADSNQVVVVEKTGQYAGRRVTFFRAFEPERLEVLLRSGHVEQDGRIVVDSRPEPEGATPVRQPANRADHTDDERLVFWDPEAARSSEAALSAPAATWLHARSSPNTPITP